MLRFLAQVAAVITGKDVNDGKRVPESQPTSTLHESNLRETHYELGE